MGLVKFVRFGLGLAASGGAVVVLSGTALAADPVQGATAQPVQTVQESSKVVPETKTPIQDASTTGAPAVKQQTSNTVNTDNRKHPSETQGQTNVTAETKATDPKTEAKALKSAVPEVPKHDETMKGEASAPMPNLNVREAAFVPAPAVVHAPAIVYRSAYLAIQPTITNRTVAGSDLAAKMPSAPVSAKTPVPAESSGSLGKLTLALAGSVVPQPFFLPPTIADWVALTVIVSVLTYFLLGLVFVSNYGLWLRRGGFATAARSDVPAAILISIFATPLLLGYVSTPPRHRSPLFGVAKCSLTLSERRKCI